MTRSLDMCAEHKQVMCGVCQNAREPREFWIKKAYRGLSSGQRYPDDIREDETHDFIHVIEHSALTRLEEENKLMREALSYYADEKNWYNPNQHTRLPNDPECRMVIASIDTEGMNWLGGRTARNCLAKLDEMKGSGNE